MLIPYMRCSFQNRTRGGSEGTRYRQAVTAAYENLDFPRNPQKLVEDVTRLCTAKRTGDWRSLSREWRDIRQEEEEEEEAGSPRNSTDPKGAIVALPCQ